MVERRLLTKEFVRTVRPPASGERWVADTKLRGFGLRLWATPTGAGKAFGVRIADKEGKKIRKTFDSRNAWPRMTGRWHHRADYELSDSLDYARRWAQSQIDLAKGRLTLEQDRERRRQRIARRMKRLTLERAVEKMTSGMRVEGRSEPYVDRLDKLFARHIPQRLRRSRLNKVSPKALGAALAAMAIRGGNVRILKSFIGQVYDRAGEFDGSLRTFSEELSRHFWARWQRENKLPFPELRDLKRSDYDLVFSRLEAEEEFWQQALCLRLFFMFGAPLYRVMHAQWWQVLDDKWYPYLADEKVHWFESGEHVRADARQMLDRVKVLGRQSFSGSPYWFPSPSHPFRPISSVQAFWRDTLSRVGSRHYPVSEFARSYRQPNNPSYIVTFIRQYGKWFREINNAAEVSNELYRRRKSSLILVP